MARVADLPHVSKDNLFKVDIDFIDPHPDNLRVHDSEYDAHIESFVAMIEAGGIIPPLVFQRHGEDRFYALDGNTRLLAAKRYRERKQLPKFELRGIMFTGNDKDAWVFAMKANMGKRNRPHELLSGYKRMQATYGWEPADIARELGVTISHVNDVLTLGQANESTIDMVRNKEVAATTVIELVRDHGPAGAQEVLDAAKQAASAAGAKKVMPRHVRKITEKSAKAEKSTETALSGEAKTDQPSLDLSAASQSVVSSNAMSPAPASPEPLLEESGQVKDGGQLAVDQAHPASTPDSGPSLTTPAPVSGNTMASDHSEGLMALLAELGEALGADGFSTSVQPVTGATLLKVLEALGHRV